MIKTVFVSAFSMCLIAVNAQKIKYDISFPNLVHHEASISLTVNDLDTKQPAIFRMSRSSPGRYATHEFGKNIYDISAYDKSGKQIDINRIDGDVYEVPSHDDFIKVQYTLFGNYMDGTYAGIDDNSVHLNMPASMLWMKGMEKDSGLIEIHFTVPQNKKWTIATQLKPGKDSSTFLAPGLQYMMDCPTRLGNINYGNWTIQNPDGKQYQFRLALDAAATQEAAQTFADKVKRITQQAQAVYGETPEYDFGTYTFLATINPYVHGDGMEHRNSTMITLPEKFTGKDDELEVFAHEFFHCWNVERIRPKTIEPFNFEKSNMSNELWLAEGFTQYYGDLIMKRCGYYTDEEWLGALSQYINVKENTPGGKYYSPVANSRNAVFVDAGVAVDQTNYPNYYASYYPYGAAVALALDLSLRTKFKNITLDNFMQTMWKKYGKTGIAYTVSDAQQALAETTNDAAFAQDFFSKYVNGHTSFDYAALLNKAGFILKKITEGKAWIGNFSFSEKTKLSRVTVKGSPLYITGVDVGDEIISLGDKVVSNETDVRQVLSEHKPGDVLTIKYKHRDEMKAGNITLMESPFLNTVTFESLDKKIEKGVKMFRQNWIDNKIKE